MSLPDQASTLWLRLKPRLMFALSWPAAMWAVFVFDALLPNSIARLDNLGIWPRSIVGLPGIAAAPFLHADIWHLLANTISFCVLGAVLVTSGRRLFTEVLVTTAIISGTGAWLFGQGGRPHEGASGVIYGMLGFLLARGWFSRKPVWAIISLVVGFFQLGSVFGLLRIDPNISWSSHFWGFVGGIALAWWRYGRDPARALPPASRS